MVTTLERAQVRATLNYTVRTDDDLYNYYFMDPPPGRSASNCVDEPHEVVITSIRNGRRPTLDVEGFELVSFTTATPDIYDAASRAAFFDREVEELVLAGTGATEVRVGTPFLRGEEAQRRAPGSITAPAGTLHVDYTVESGPSHVAAAFGWDVAALRGRRFAIINVWRPITGPLRDHPLALGDAQTIPLRDLMRSKSFSVINADGTHGGSDGTLEEAETYSVAYDPAHRWYYAPGMTTDEALLLKNYDSDTSGISRFSPHSAFHDPTTPVDVLPRASIEVRAYTVW